MQYNSEPLPSGLMVLMEKGHVVHKELRPFDFLLNRLGYFHSDKCHRGQIFPLMAGFLIDFQVTYPSF